MELGDEFLELAGRLNDPALVVAHRMAGNPRFFVGELSAAREHYERAVALYDPPRHRSLTWLYGAEPGMNAAILLAAVLWLQGYPDGAAERTRQARRIAEEVSHANTRGYALCYEGMNHVFRRDWKRVLETADSLVPLATEQGLAMWRGYGRILRGRAMAEDEGRAAEGAEEIRQGLDAVRTLGAELNLPLYFSLLAEACVRAGRIKDGLRAIEQGLSFAEKNEERYWQGELHRLRGELLLQQGVPASEVELSFRRSAEISRKMGARSLELRAAMSLARLWQQQEKREDARLQLADLYGTFTEGHDTPDLIEARALLKNG
jgi:adenylate cyclase